VLPHHEGPEPGYIVCLPCALFSASSLPGSTGVHRPQLKLPRSICLFTTTTVGAHRGASSDAGWVSSGRDPLHRLRRRVAVIFSVAGEPRRHQRPGARRRRASGRVSIANAVHASGRAPSSSAPLSSPPTPAPGRTRPPVRTPARSSSSPAARLVAGLDLRRSATSTPARRLLPAALRRSRRDRRLHQHRNKYCEYLS